MLPWRQSSVGCGTTNIPGSGFTLICALEWGWGATGGAGDWGGQAGGWGSQLPSASPSSPWSPASRLPLWHIWGCLSTWSPVMAPGWDISRISGWCLKTEPHPQESSSWLVCTPQPQKPVLHALSETQFSGDKWALIRRSRAVADPDPGSVLRGPQEAPRHTAVERAWRASGLVWEVLYVWQGPSVLGVGRTAEPGGAQPAL